MATKHILIAELHALKSGRVYVKAFMGQKEASSRMSKEYPTLNDAEAYAFSLGAEAIASVKDQPGILRATRQKAQKHVYQIEHEGITYTRSTYNTYTHAFVGTYTSGRKGELKCSGSYQNAYKMRCQWVGWYGQAQASPITEIVPLGQGA